VDVPCEVPGKNCLGCSILLQFRQHKEQSRKYAMAKASSPIRIQSELMSNAAVLGKLHHRSAAEQIEYWASIGQKVESLLDPESLLQKAHHRRTGH